LNSLGWKSAVRTFLPFIKGAGKAEENLTLVDDFRPVERSYIETHAYAVFIAFGHGQIMLLKGHE
jgi:hypothetical protein